MSYTPTNPNGQAAMSASSPVVIASDQTALPLSTNAATETGIQQIVNAIKAQIEISTSVWTDDSGAYYVRRDSINEGTGVITVYFTDASGSTVTPGAGLKPLSSSEKEVIQTLFDATSSGTGYSSGDILGRLQIIDPNQASPTSTILWFNITANTSISAPTGGTFVQSNEFITASQGGTWNVGITGTVPLPTDASTETTQASVLSVLGTIEADLAAIYGDTSNIFINASNIDAKTPILGPNTAVGCVPVVIASDQKVPTSLDSITFQYSANGVNSSTSQLAAGATFTGVREAIPNQPSYSILLFSDQNGTITINEYIDSTTSFKVFTKTYNYLANGQFSISNVANGNFFQVIFTNTGGSTTTLFNLNTAYGVIPSATQLNNSPVSIEEIAGTAFSLGQKPAATSLPVTQSTESATGNITIANSVMTGTATAGSAVELLLNGCGIITIQVTGTYTAGSGLVLQLTNDGVTWVSVQNTPLVNLNNGVYSASISSGNQGIYKAEVSGFFKARITGAGAVTGTAVITLRGSMTSSVVTIAQGLPTGSATIGTVLIGNTPNTAAILANPFNPAVGTAADTGVKTATYNGATQTNNNAKGALVIVNISATSGTGQTLTMKMQMSADGGTNWVDIPTTTTAAINATGAYGTLIYPGIGVVASTGTAGQAQSVPQILPKTWRMVYTIGGATPSFTIASVQISYII